MSWSQPGLNDFKTRFVRDFPYAPKNDAGNLDYVIDGDINSAMAQAGASFNTAIGAEDLAMTEMFLLLSAFYLTESLKLAQKGINSQAQFLAQSKSVGGVSVSFQIPEWISRDPQLAKYTSNGYGKMYLDMAIPFLVGGAATVAGGTTNA
jgi:hypothetical protein